MCEAGSKRAQKEAESGQHANQKRDPDKRRRGSAYTPSRRFRPSCPWSAARREARKLSRSQESMPGLLARLFGARSLSPSAVPRVERAQATLYSEYETLEVVTAGSDAATAKGTTRSRHAVRDSNAFRIGRDYGWE